MGMTASSINASSEQINMTASTISTAPTPMRTPTAAPTKSKVCVQSRVRHVPKGSGTLDICSGLNLTETRRCDCGMVTSSPEDQEGIYKLLGGTVGMASACSIVLCLCCCCFVTACWLKRRRAAAADPFSEPDSGGEGVEGGKRKTRGVDFEGNEASPLPGQVASAPARYKPLPTCDPDDNVFAAAGVPYMPGERYENRRSLLDEDEELVAGKSHGEFQMNHSEAMRLLPVTTSFGLR